MPFILSSIKSITRATDSNNAERQPQVERRSLNNIAQHPQYRKAILRIGESNHNVHYLNHLYSIHFSYISYYIALDKFHHCRSGSEQYAQGCIYPDGHLCLLHFTFFAQLICLHPTGVPFTYPRQAVFLVKLCNRCVNTLFVDLSLVGMRTLPYGIIAAFDPVSPTSGGNRIKPFILTIIFTGAHQCCARIARQK